MLQTQPGKFRGMGDAFRQVVATSGAAGLYRGVASPLVGMGIFNAVQFAIFGSVKNYLTDNGRSVTLNRIAGAAAFTGVFVAFVEGPQDLFKCQMQAGGRAYASTSDCVRTIIRERGYAGTMQGISATIVRNVIGVTAYFYVYEAARLQFAGDKPVTSLSPLAVMLAGGLGGVGYWTLCYVRVIERARAPDIFYSPPPRRTIARTRARSLTPHHPPPHPARAARGYNKVCNSVRRD